MTVTKKTQMTQIYGCHNLRPLRHLRPCTRAVSPVVALCGLFSGRVETCPARTAEAPSERVTGKRKRTVPVILNEVKNPFSLLHADRDGSGGTEAEVRILRLRCAPLRMTTAEGWNRQALGRTRKTDLQSLRVLPGLAGASRAAGCPPPAAEYRAEARTHFS